MARTMAILGPPGTGKTQTLIGLVDEFYSHGPKMAVLSFSKSAALELTSRIRNKKPEFVGTIHSLCFKLLNLVREQVVDIKGFCRWIGGDEEIIKSAIEIGGLAKRSKQSLKDTYSMIIPSISFDILQFYCDIYAQWKKDKYLLDFDDMLEQGRKTDVKFDTIIVDEAQDLSKLQWDFILKITGDRLIIAGDDDQAIYTWAGAYPHGIAEIGDDFKVLNQSYRIPITVHEVAQRTIKQVSKRKAKRYKPRPEKGYVNYIEEYSPFQGFEHAVLCRDNWTMSEVEKDLIFHAIPYRIEGPFKNGIFQGPYANIIRAIKDRDLDKVRRFYNYLTPYGQEAVDGGQFPEDWQLSVNVPFEHLYYYDRVDLTDRPMVILSTIHAQKGKEHDHVFINAQCTPKVEDSFDGIQSFDNEVRVWYVAITRARKGVTIIGDNNYICK